MTDLQEKFLDLVVVQQVKFDLIPSVMGIDRAVVSQWYRDLKSEREQLATLVQIWKRKCKTTGFSEFKTWFHNTPQACCYCGITQEELTRLFEAGKIIAKSGRGRTLEFERKEAELSYDCLDNLALACYWCNNAKTDTFSSTEFEPVGRAIGLIFKARLDSLDAQNAN